MVQPVQEDHAAGMNQWSAGGRCSTSAVILI